MHEWFARERIKFKKIYIYTYDKFVFKWSKNELGEIGSSTVSPVLQRLEEKEYVEKCFLEDDEEKELCRILYKIIEQEEKSK